MASSSVIRNSHKVLFPANNGNRPTQMSIYAVACLSIEYGCFIGIVNEALYLRWPSVHSCVHKSISSVAPVESFVVVVIGASSLFPSVYSKSTSQLRSEIGLVSSSPRAGDSPN